VRVQVSTSRRFLTSFKISQPGTNTNLVINELENGKQSGVLVNFAGIRGSTR
jgi:hypothetical protein